MEIDGSVAKGLTFVMAGGSAPTNSLQIDDPSKFHGLIDFPSHTLFSFVAFIGLHATSADIRHDMLRLFDGQSW